MTYSQKLRDPRWQKRRLEILQRDDWTCHFCRTKEKNLQVHHVTYGKCDPWDYPEHLLQTLCEDCHEERQELCDKIVDAVRICLKEVPNERLLPAAKNVCAAAMLEIEVGG